MFMRHIHECQFNFVNLYTEVNNKKKQDCYYDYPMGSTIKHIYFRPKVTLHCYYILREKSLEIYFGDSQFRRNRTFNFIVSKLYVDKRSRVR